MRSITFEYEAKNYDYLEHVTLEALKNGVSVTVNLDYAPALDAEDVRLLAGLLKLSRETGSEFTLRATRPDVRRTLAVTALDQVFKVRGSEAV